MIEASNIIPTKNTIDSLDSDTSNYITNLPDSIGAILYPLSDSLLAYIKKSSVINSKKKSTLLSDTLIKVLKQNGFQVDDSQKEIVAIKKLFNKRQLITWHSNKASTITAEVIYWHLGKKYILIRQCNA